MKISVILKCIQNRVKTYVFIRSKTLPMQLKTPVNSSPILYLPHFVLEITILLNLVFIIPLLFFKLILKFCISYMVGKAPLTILGDPRKTFFLTSCYTLIKIEKSLTQQAKPFHSLAFASTVSAVVLPDLAALLVYSLRHFSAPRSSHKAVFSTGIHFFPLLTRNDSCSSFRLPFKCCFSREAVPDPSNSNLVCLQRSCLPPFNFIADIATLNCVLFV